MTKRIVLALAILAALGSGGYAVSVLTAQPAAACGGASC